MLSERGVDDATMSESSVSLLMYPVLDNPLKQLKRLSQYRVSTQLSDLLSKFSHAT